MQSVAQVRLRQWLSEQGMSYREFGIRLNCSGQTIWLWVSRGQIPTLPFAVAVERETGISAHAWLDPSEAPAAASHRP